MSESYCQLDIFQAILVVGPNQSDRILDPGLLFDQLPESLKASEVDRYVRLKSDLIIVEMRFDTFLGKTYVIEGDSIKIGFRKLDLSNLKMEIVVKVILQP
jgi:hypothetical protein